MRGSNNAAGVVMVHVLFAALLVLGVTCLFAPRAMQRLALRQSRYAFGFRRPPAEWMKTEGYVFYFRAMGLVFLVVGAAVELAVNGFFL